MTRPRQRRGPDRRQEIRRASGRRASDRRHSKLASFLRDNWYRDVWLSVISIAMCIVAFQVLNIAEDLVSTRRTAIADSCTADMVQTDVLRSLIDASLDQRKRMEDQGQKPPPGSLTPAQTKKLLDTVLKPLGGFHPTPEQKKAICARRVDRGSPP